MNHHTTTPSRDLTRRDFVKTAAFTAAAAGTATSFIARAAYAGGTDSVRVGVIGCGGRGTGAATDALSADPATQIVAMADVFPDRLNQSRANLAGSEQFAQRSTVADSRCYTGFDAYKQLLDSTEIDYVILATPPGFRPIHFEAAVHAGKHIFCEKPVGVDGPGVRRVLAAAELATQKGLAVVAGTQRRHQDKYLQIMERVHAGAIGTLTGAYCWWNQGGLWKHERKPEWSDMEWQCRNWYYFTWTCGDHIVEQHVHNLDVCNWAVKAHPVKARGMGGRQVRVEPVYGNIFDHFAVEFEYPGGVKMSSYCRQIDGCTSKVDELLIGTEGIVKCAEGVIEGKNPWKYQGPQTNAYIQEHADLIKAIRAGGKPINEGKNVAESTLTAIMGRMSAYTGQEVTWEQALNSQEDLSPKSYEFGPNPVPPVAVPGKTPVV
jgi:predicted dehydrogenase